MAGERTWGKGRPAWAEFAGGRRMALLEIGALRCPRGHRIESRTVLGGELAIECDHKEVKSGPHRRADRCGAWLYVVATVDPRVMPLARAGVIVVEVTYAEVVELIRPGHLSTRDILGKLDVLPFSLEETA